MPLSKKNIPLVVLFGRPNVGKSTLFNKLTGKNQALTSNIEGTTRDSNIGMAEWQGKKFKLIDTGGILDIREAKMKKITAEEEAELINQKIQHQAYDYLKKADLVLFLVDTKSGVLPTDKEFARHIQKMQIADKVLLIANKADSARERKEIAEFYQLNLGEPLAVSAANGSGSGDMLDLAIKKLKKIKPHQPAKKDLNETEKQKAINVLIIGEPNVGKSSLLNAISKEERVIVSPIAHTTREPQDEIIEYNDQLIRFVDTAGLSRAGMKSGKKKIFPLEKQGIAKSLGVLNQADIVIFMLDITRRINHLETKIADEIIGRKKSIIIAANKWDLIPEKDVKKYTEYINAKLPFMTWAPIYFLSAKTGSKVDKMLDLVLELKENREKQLTEKEIDKFIRASINRHKPTKSGGYKKPRIYAMRQVKTNPPEFEIRIGAGESLADSYLRFLENGLRKIFNLTGTPVAVRVKRK